MKSCRLCPLTNKVMLVMANGYLSHIWCGIRTNLGLLDWDKD